LIACHVTALFDGLTDDLLDREMEALKQITSPRHVPSVRALLPHVQLKLLIDPIQKSHPTARPPSIGVSFP